MPPEETPLSRPKKRVPKKFPFHMIIKVVVFLYILWIAVVIGDLVMCRVRANECESQMNEVKGVFTTVTVGLMGWVSDSPMR